MKPDLEALEEIFEIKLHPSSWNPEMVEHVVSRLEIILALNFDHESEIEPLVKRFEILATHKTETTLSKHRFNLRFGKLIDETINTLDKIPRLNEEE